MSSRVGSWLQQLIVHQSGLSVLRSNYDPGSDRGWKEGCGFEEKRTTSVGVPKSDLARTG